jgi:hypothetical protein
MGDEKDAKRGGTSKTPLSPTPLKVEITDAKGKDKKKYAIARMPPPREDPEPWSAKVNSKDEIPATIKFNRDGKEADVAWAGGAAPKIVFKGGVLNVKIHLVDGPDADPVASERTGVVTIASIQQGDAVIVQENRSKGRDQVAVVKNFTWNDLTRRKTKLTVAADFSTLPDKLKNNVIETIKFVLNPGATSEQAKQREALKKAFEKSHPSDKLATLAIPSALGVGVYPDDSSHFHFAVAARSSALSAEVEAFDKKEESAKTKFKIDDAKGVEDPADRKKFLDHYKAMLKTLVAMLTKAAAGTGPFTIYHTYEFVNVPYVDPAGVSRLKFGDPIRNIKTPLDTNKPQLFAPPDIGNASSWMSMPDTANVAQIGFFVNKKGEIVLYSSVGLISGTSGESLPVSDALGET